MEKPLKNLVLNSNFDPSARYSELTHLPVDIERARTARAEISLWSDARETPLLELPGFAQKYGYGRVLVKDEARRGSLKSFKALGGAYALGEALRDHIEIRDGRRPSQAELFAREHPTGDFCAVAVTDGNHGRSLAWGAEQFGVRCIIYLPDIVSEDRAEAIAKFGAEIRRIKGNYDEVYRHMCAEASKHNWAVVQDISTPDDLLCHQRIMEGYTLMADEIFNQLEGEPPSHVFLQVGCGGMAAAIMSHFLIQWPERRPRFVLLEAETAASTVESFRNRAPVRIDGSHETIMVGIAVGETSYLPWLLFDKFAHSAMTVNDEDARIAMRIAAYGIENDPAFVSGETGACGLAALLSLSKSPALKERIGLDEESSILVINSEGDTDPGAYRSIVGEALILECGRIST